MNSARESHDTPIAVGIAGLGRAGWNSHANVLATLPKQYRVAAVCDESEDRRNEAAKRFDCAAYPTLDQLVADDAVDLVVIATPSHLHADQAQRAMVAGKHVLVEKPFATSLDDADRMIATSRETGRLVIGSHNLRYSADFMKVQEVIKSGRLGAIVEIRINSHSFRRRWDWQTLQSQGGGSLNNDGSHWIDLALLLFGAQEPEVFCRLVHTPLSSGDAEDHVKVILTAPDAPLVDLEFSNACAYPQERWLVFGTQGGLVGGDGRFRWRYIEPALLPAREPLAGPAEGRTYNREELPWVQEQSDLSAETSTTGHVRMYQDLFGVIRHDRPLGVTPESIRRQLAVIERCRASLISQL